MKVEFNKIPAKYINMEADTEKRANMEALLASFGFTKVSRSVGIKNRNKRAGVSAAHMAALLNESAPLAVFEDDCVLLNKKTEVEVPDDADALFLGHIGITADNPKNQKVIEGAHYQSVAGFTDLYKVTNLLSGHAIVYLSQKYLEAVTETLEKLQGSYAPHDVQTSSLQKTFNVYAVGLPLVFQQGTYKELTNKHLTKY